jgi:hypothetical protein
LDSARDIAVDAGGSLSDAAIAVASTSRDAEPLPTSLESAHAGHDTSDWVSAPSDASAWEQTHDVNATSRATNGTDVASTFDGTITHSEASTSDVDDVEGIIGVGYGGIRVVSRDRGLTWEDEVHWTEGGGDDFQLLRTIAYGNGLWVSGGWQVTTSDDGVHWTEPLPAEDVISAVNCQVTDGMAFGNGRFLVACGSSLARSVDGTNWERVGDTPDVGGHPYLVFDPATARFACSGDDGGAFVSVDGGEWTRLESDSVHLCASGFTPRDECRSFFFDGVYLSAEWGGHIRRSTDAKEWQAVYTDGFDNNLFTEYAFAVGRVAL